MPCPTLVIKVGLMIKNKKQRAPKLKGFKIKASPLTEDQIKMFVGHFSKYGSFPGSKIPCTITGKLTTAVGPWLKKKVKEFGSAEGLLRGYTCRQVNKQQRIVAIGKKKKNKHDGDGGLVKEDGCYDIPKVKLVDYSRPLTEPELSKDTETTCLRPDIFLSNGRHCDGCPYYKICRSRLKNLPKHISFDGSKFTSKEERKKK